MSDVLQRTTKEQRFSVNTPDYSEVIWVINPDLSGVVGVPKKYWKITGDVVSEMNQSEKDAVDAVLLPGTKATRKDQLQIDADNLIENQGYTDGIQRSLLAFYSKEKGARANKAKYLRDWNDWVEQVDTNVSDKQTLVNDATTIAAVNAITLDSGVLIAADPVVKLSTAINTSDSTDLYTFMDANAEVTDPLTGVVGPFQLMQTLSNRRELVNDSSNPVYYADMTAILGPTGYLVDHANRINNLETIHGKLGWHNQTIVESTYTRPQDLLVYYGYPNSFNSGVNVWNNENVSQDMAAYRLIILGNGVAAPSHPDYANTQIITDRVKALSNHTQIYGYVSANQAFRDYTNEVIQWGALGVAGIFMDEAGYDFGRTRAEFNTRVDYVHDRTSTDLCFANAWNTKHILGTENDPSYPNSTYNDTSAESNLTVTDWIMLESFPINTTSFTASSPDGYESKTDWIYRGDTMKYLRATYGVNFAGLGIINNANSDGTALFDFGFTSAMMYNLEAFGTSDTNYGASSAAVKKWVRPDVSQLGVVYCLNCMVKVDTGDADVYQRYVENGKFILDFSESAQTSIIQKY